jgi:hypothetical protein
LTLGIGKSLDDDVAISIARRRRGFFYCDWVILSGAKDLASRLRF